MRRIERSALLPYPAAEVYALVNDIERYPQYLKWCKAAFAAYVLPKTVVQSQLRLPGGRPVEVLWAVLIKVAAPLGVLTVFVYTLYHFVAG